MSLAVPLPQAKRLVETCLKAKKVPFLRGSPGTGKSTAIKDIANEWNLELIDYRLAQCDPTDLLGFPSINKKTDRAGYKPMDTFPLDGDPLPKGKDGWLLFLDEANSADRSVQKAAYKLVLDREVGMFKLHPRVAIVCAGNLDTDNAITEELSSALQSRLIHLFVKSDIETYLRWANARGLDHRICSFMRFKPSAMNTFNPKTQGAEPTYACERTWEFTHDLLQQIDESSPDALPLLGGALGEGTAREFLAYLRIFAELPHIDEVLKAPATTKVPSEPGSIYAMTGCVAQYATDTNISTLMTYVERFPKEYQVVCLRDMGMKNHKLLATPSVEKWILENNKDIF